MISHLLAQQTIIQHSIIILVGQCVYFLLVLNYNYHGTEEHSVHIVTALDQPPIFVSYLDYVMMTSLIRAESKCLAT